MRRLIAWFIDGLPLDDRSRRALDETMLDWATEIDQTAPSQRWLAHALGSAGVVRALAGCSLTELTRVPFGWLLQRFLLFAAPLVLLTMWGIVVHLDVARIGGYVSAAESLVWLLPGNLIVAAMPALLLAVSWRSGERRIPAVGTAVAASLAMFVLVSWVLPLSNQMYNRQTSSGFAGIQAARLLPVPHEPTLVDFIQALDGPPATRTAGMNGLARICGWSALAGATVLLGVAMSRRVRMRGLLLLVTIPLQYSLAAMANAAVFLRLMPAAFRDAGLVWMFVALTLAVFLTVHRRSRAPLDVNG